MSGIKTTNVTDAKWDEMKFSTPRTNTGKRFIKVFYEKNPLVLRLPKLKIPFDSQLSQYGQLEMNVSLGSNEKVITALKEMDDQMMTFVDTHGWYNKDDEKTYFPSLRESKNGDYPPTFKIKIPKRDGVIDADFFDKDKKKIKVNNDSDVLSLLKKNTHVISAIECTGAWFMGDRYGLSWKVVQMRVYEPEPQSDDTIEGYSFQDSSDDEEIEECLIYD